METIRCTECESKFDYSEPFWASKTFPAVKPTLCYSCRSAKDPDEYYDDDMLRCPHCGKTQEAISDCDRSYLYEEGQHTIFCEEENCGLEFEITSYVSISFKSPALNRKQ